MWKMWIAALVGGVVFGFVAIFGDRSGIPGVNFITTYLGLWVMLVTLIAAWSQTWQRASVYSVTFLVAMVMSYYLFQMQQSGFFSTRLFAFWLAIGLFVAPVFAFLVWPARQVGWRSAFAAALPTSLLIWEAYSQRFRLTVNEEYPILVAFDLICAAVLLVVLPANATQRLRILTLTPVLFVAIDVGNHYLIPALGLPRL